MILVGQGIHVISREIGKAIHDRNQEPIQRLARQQAEAGADYLDLNLGALTRDPVPITEWVVKAVQEVTDLPLSIDTTNPVAMEAALRICHRKPLINSANGGRMSKESFFSLAVKYSADLIVMNIDDQGLPNDADERAALAMNLAEYADGIGLPVDRLWFDGVLLPACVNQAQIVSYIEFIKIFNEVVPGARTITGLSNISSCGTPEDRRGLLNRTLFVILNRYGHSALIADVLDEELMRFNRGELTDLVELIYRAEDGVAIDHSSLTETQRAYVKTVDLVLGRQLYSHSWLEA